MAEQDTPIDVRVEHMLTEAACCGRAPSAVRLPDGGAADRLGSGICRRARSPAHRGALLHRHVDHLLMPRRFSPHRLWGREHRDLPSHRLGIRHRQRGAAGAGITSDLYVSIAARWTPRRSARRWRRRWVSCFSAVDVQPLVLWAPIRGGTAVTGPRNDLSAASDVATPFAAPKKSPPKRGVPRCYVIAPGAAPSSPTAAGEAPAGSAWTNQSPVHLFRPAGSPGTVRGPQAPKRTGRDGACAACRPPGTIRDVKAVSFHSLDRNRRLRDSWWI